MARGYAFQYIGVPVLDGGGDELLYLARHAGHGGADDEDAKALLLPAAHDPGDPLPRVEVGDARPAEFDHYPRAIRISAHK